jgi:hypothetical protein
MQVDIEMGDSEAITEPYNLTSKNPTSQFQDMSTSSVAGAAAAGSAGAGAEVPAPSPMNASSSLSRSSAVAGFFFSRLPFSRGADLPFVRIGPGPEDCLFLEGIDEKMAGYSKGRIDLRSFGVSSKTFGKRLLFDAGQERTWCAGCSAERRTSVVLDSHGLTCIDNVSTVSSGA